MSIVRLKALKEPVYSQKEAEAAAGMGNYVLYPPDTMAAFQNTDMETVEPAWNDILMMHLCM